MMFLRHIGCTAITQFDDTGPGVAISKVSRVDPGSVVEQMPAIVTQVHIESVVTSSPCVHGLRPVVVAEVLRPASIRQVD